MGIVIHLDKDGTGGSGTGWNGQVEFRADLPITLGTPAIGEIYLVEKKTTLLGFTTYQSGLYIRDFNNGNLNDWRRLNVKVNFTDSEFAIVNAVDTSKKSKFDLSLVSTSTTRTYSLPDKDGTVAMLSDIVGGSTFYTSDGTFTDATRNANITANNVLNFISKAALPIDDKTALKITANGIFGSLETDLSIRFNGSNAQNYSTYSNNIGSFIFNDGVDNISFSFGRGGSGQQLQYFDLNAGFRTDIFFTTPTQNNTLNFPDKSGTLAVLSDITGGSTTLRNITTTDTFSTPNETLNCTSGTFTVNLPTAVGIQGVVYTLVNSGTGIITLDANGTETINGSETIEIKKQYVSRTVQSDGSNWIII